MEDPADRLHRMLAGLGPPPPLINSSLPGTPFGMTAYEQAQMETARQARTASDIDQMQASGGLQSGNIGGYRPGPEWDVFFNALKGQTKPLKFAPGSGSLMPDSPAPGTDGLPSWKTNPLVPKGDGTY